MKRNIFLLIVSAFIVFSFNACQDRSDLTAPVAPGTGSASFVRLVSIGNSLTAGIQSNSLFESAQNYTIGAQIARQVGGVTYAQPIVTDPGMGQRIEVQALTPSVVINYNYNQGTPTNSNYALPYNNLGISGAILYDIMDTTDFAAKSAARKNPYFSLVLRNAAFGKSIYEQAKKQNPTFILLDIGNNDALGYCLSGGTSGTDATGKLPTDGAVFNALFNQLIGKIAAEMPNTKVAVANIPNINSIPYVTTVGPQMAVGLAGAKLANPAIVGLIYQKNSDGTGPGTGVSPAITDVMITLPGMVYAPLLGKSTGQFYRDNKFPALPAGIDTTKPFGFHPQNPWPNALVLDADEQAKLATAVTSFNQTIKAAVDANPNNFVLVDANKLYNNLRANDAVGGTVYNGVKFMTSFISGGLFSLDGVHPSSQGYAIMANEFISAINAKWGASIPLINVAAVPASNPLAKMGINGQLDKIIAKPGVFNNIQF